jgi:hypothetical protein
MSLTPFHGPPAQAPVVPGFVARMLIGSGAHGEVWVAREQISGDEVALKIGSRVSAPGGAPFVREAELLSRFDHPHLVRLRRVVAMPEGSAALVLDLAGGGSLAALVAARGRLPAGEVVTMLVPLAEVLHELHDKGVAHGDVSPGNVLFSADGRPMLGDLGVSSVLGARQEGLWSTPGFADPALPRSGDRKAADIWALAAVAWFALTGRPPAPLDGDSLRGDELRGDALTGDVLDRPLLALLAECLAEAPSDRPALLEIAARAWEAVPALPVGLTITPPDVRGRPLPDIEPAPAAAALLAVTRRSAARPPFEDPAGALVAGAVAPARLGRRHLVAAAGGCVITAVAASVWFGLIPGPGLNGDAPGLSPVKSAGSAQAREQPITQVLREIAAARALAFERVSASPLRTADAPGSDAERMDAAVIAQLRRSRIRLEGIRYELSGVHAVAPAGSGASAGPGTGELAVLATVSTSSHRQISLHDGRIREVPATAPQRVRLTLVRAPGRAAGSTSRTSADAQPGDWLVQSVEPVQ